MENNRLLACAAGVLLLQACTSTTPETTGARPPIETASPSHSLTPSSTPTKGTPPRVAAKLGPPPTDCTGPAPDPRPVVRLYGSLEGKRPVWAGIYARYRREHQAFYASDARRTRYGYRIKVLWIIHPRQESPVTIEGRRVGTGGPIYFDVGGTGKPVRSARLDPDDPGTVSQHDWKEYPSYLFFGHAGCYELEARWRGGSWRRVFGFGRR